MTYDKSNIVGVEFTVKGERPPINYKIISVKDNKATIEWTEPLGDCRSTFSVKRTVLKYLNNGTWIVKNSKA